MENKILGAVTKGMSQGMGREAQGTQLLTAHSSSLHRECTMKLGNIPLCGLEPSNSELSLVDGFSARKGCRSSKGTEQSGTAASPVSLHSFPGVRSPH